MWNPGLERRNRRGRRNAAKYNGDIKRWSELKHGLYATQGAPTASLGIKAHKRLGFSHQDIQLMKERGWKQYNELVAGFEATNE